MARARLGYDEVFANQLAMALVRAVDARAQGPGAGRRRAAARPAQAALRADRRAGADGARDRGRSGAGGADAAAAAGRCRLGQDAGRGDGAADRGRGGRAGRRCWRRPRSSRGSITRRCARTLAGLPVEVAVLTGRDKGRAREATLMGLADGSIDILVGTHAIFQEAVGLSRPGAGGGRRAAPLRRRRAAAAAGQGPRAAPAGDDRDADPAHADAGAIWRDGRQPARRDAARAASRSRRASCRRSGWTRSSTRSAGIWPRASRPIGCARWSRRARSPTSPPPRRAPRRCGGASASGSGWSTAG